MTELSRRRLECTNITSEDQMRGQQTCAWDCTLPAQHEGPCYWPEPPAPTPEGRLEQIKAQLAVEWRLKTLDGIHHDHLSDLSFLIVEVEHAQSLLASQAEEIATLTATFNSCNRARRAAEAEVSHLRADRDSWRRVAETLERARQAAEAQVAAMAAEAEHLRRSNQALGAETDRLVAEVATLTAERDAAQS